MSRTRHTSALLALFGALFLAGTIVATIGWLAEWKHLDRVYPFFRHSTIIALAGHAMQVIGAFGGLVEPEGEEDED